MAVTITPSAPLATANRLVYLLTASGAGTGDITNNATAGGGAAGSCLSVDAAAGPIHAIAFAAVNGIGNLAPGALNQAKARAALLSDGATSLGSAAQVTRANCRIQSRGATPAIWSVDANVNGNGDPILNLTASAADTAYLIIDSEASLG